MPVIEVVIPAPEPPPPPPAPPQDDSCTLDAAFVADVTVPDGTLFQATQAINKVWRMRNTGTCTWDTTSVLRFVGGFRMGAPQSRRPRRSHRPGRHGRHCRERIRPGTGRGVPGCMAARLRPGRHVLRPEDHRGDPGGRRAARAAAAAAAGPAAPRAPEAGEHQVLGRAHESRRRWLHEGALGGRQRPERALLRRPPLEGCGWARQQEAVPQELDELPAAGGRSVRPHPGDGRSA